MMRHWVAFAVALSVQASPVDAKIDTSTVHRYTILSQDLVAALEEFSASINVPLNVDPDVEGRVDNFRGQYTAHDFLMRLAAEHRLVWYFDGDTLHVTPAAANRSVFVDFRNVTPEMLQETLDSLAVADARFPVRSTGSEGIGVITGPPRYIELIDHAFTLLQGQVSTPEATATAPAKTSVTVVRGGTVHQWTGPNSQPPASPDAAVQPAPQPQPGDVPAAVPAPAPAPAPAAPTPNGRPAPEVPEAVDTAVVLPSSN